ncbi:MAG: hypothetical protein J6C96_04345 [Oscillospiraceae bacterium]|nr:hypothetical protein [Oscillospiraceae bacterium]
MAEKRCPLCQGRLVKGECPSCGYTVPSEEDLSAVYNYEPSDYPQPEEPMQMREITPDVQMDEIYPGRADPPKFKVRDNGGKTVKGTAEESPFANKGAAEGSPFANNVNTAADNGNPYANQDGSFKPYNSPFANQTANNTGSIGEFFQKYWWMLLMSFFFPIIGVILFIMDKNDLKNSSYKWIFIAAIVLGFILPP